MRRPYRNFPANPDDCASYAELKMCYSRLHDRYLEEKRMKGATTHLLRKTGQSEREAKREAKKATKELVTISRKQKAKDEANKAGLWSGAAAVCCTIMYEIFKVAGFPGGAKWTDFWQHEAVYGTIMWGYTMVFAWVYKDLHPESK